MAWATITSVSLFVLSLIICVTVILQLPPEHFANNMSRSRPQFGLVGRGGRNLVGLILVIIGLAMLVLPGQGILTILIGLTLMDFPGKSVLEQKLIRRPGVFQGLNKMRQRFGKAPFLFPKNDGR